MPRYTTRRPAKGYPGGGTSQSYSPTPIRYFRPSGVGSLLFTRSRATRHAGRPNTLHGVTIRNAKSRRRANGRRRDGRRTHRTMRHPRHDTITLSNEARRVRVFVRNVLTVLLL